MKKLSLITLICVLFSLQAIAQKTEKAYGLSFELPKGWSFDSGKNNYLIASPDNKAFVTITAHDLNAKDPVAQEKEVNDIIYKAIKKEAIGITDAQIKAKLQKKTLIQKGQGFIVYTLVSDPDEDNEKTWVEIYYTYNKKKQMVLFTASETTPADDIIPDYFIEVDGIFGSLKVL